MKQKGEFMKVVIVTILILVAAGGHDGGGAKDKHIINGHQFRV